MKDREELRTYVSKDLGVPEEDLIWSDKCINPTEGFTHDLERDTQKPRALGYWVMK